MSSELRCIYTVIIYIYIDVYSILYYIMLCYDIIHLRNSTYISLYIYIYVYTCTLHTNINVNLKLQMSCFFTMWLLCSINWSRTISAPWQRIWTQLSYKPVQRPATLLCLSFWKIMGSSRTKEWLNILPMCHHCHHGCRRLCKLPSKLPIKSPWDMKPRHSAIAQPLLPSSLQVWAWATLSQEHFVSVFLASFFLPVSSISHATEALGLDLQTIKRLPFLSLSLPLSLCLSLSLSLSSL